MQSISSEQPKPLVTMFGHRWNPACADMRRFLSRNQITFDWVTSDSLSLPTLWQGPLPEEGDCPVLRLADGKVLRKPKARDVAQLLGLQTSARLHEYDTVIVGGGPAGLAAAVYGASEGLRTLCIEREAPGGQAETSSRIENYLGFPSGVSGDELASRALQQARRLGAEILVTRAVRGIDPQSRAIALDGGEVVHARAIILATGVSWRRLTLDGFDRLIGKGDLAYRAQVTFNGVTAAGVARAWDNFKADEARFATSANGQPAAAIFRLDADGSYHAHALHVLTPAPGGIARIVVFLQSTVFELFDLPMTIDHEGSAHDIAR